MKIGISVIIFLTIAFYSFSQRPVFSIKKSQQPIVLDAVLDEEAWQNAEVVSDLVQQFPYDTSRSKVRTEFRATHDDDFIYFSAVAYDNKPGGHVISSLRRDFRGPGLDGVSVILDTFQDVTNAFFFGLNPAGVQREGLISNGYLRGEDLDLSWDNKWYGHTRVYDNHWIAEWAIPFKTLRFKAGAKKWNVKLYRQDSKENERAIWPFTPRFFEPGNLNYTGEMIWEEPLSKPGPNVSVIPYLATKAAKDYDNETPTKKEFQFGGDAKIGVSASLNLDLTVNPDFSQVEVDQQVTNLDRFEIFFPERRQFFLENADLFSSFGHPNARPFFSRRIGVARDANTGQNIQNRILFGGRLSGNLNKKWRVGVLNMQTAAVRESGIPSYNYTVATTQRRVGTNSNIRALLVNRQQFSTDSTAFKLGGYGYNRVAGVDYNYSFKNNRWTGNLFYHKLFTNTTSWKEFAHGYSLIYNTQKINFNWYHQVVGTGFNPAVGYVPRGGYKRISPSGGYNFYPRASRVNNHGPRADMAFIWDDVFGYTDRDLNYSYLINFQNQGYVMLTYRNVFTYLFNDFDPTNSPSSETITKLPAFSRYSYSSVNLNLTSDPRKVFNYTLSATSGNYFNGTIQSLKATLNYRFQPYGVISLNGNYTDIKLPDPYKSAKIYLVGPRFDLTLSRSVFFTTFFQYNSQYNNVNVNSRFQWRFKPVSDLFIVYTDNYYYSFDQPGQNFNVKNRALVIKLTYWFNI
jgi:hypothetical protein